MVVYQTVVQKIISGIIEKNIIIIIQLLRIYFLLAVCIVSFNLQAATPEQNMFDDL